MPKSKSLCTGCYQDFYNHNREGGCWSYSSAKVVKRTSVGTWQPPPYKWCPQTTLSCHTAPQGYHWIKRDDPRIKEKS